MGWSCSGVLSLATGPRELLRRAWCVGAGLGLAIGWLGCPLVELGAQAPQAGVAPPASVAAPASLSGASSQAAVADELTPAAAELRELSGKLSAALSAGDAAGVAQLFVEGGELIDEGGVMHRGRAEIQDLVAAFATKFPDRRWWLSRNRCGRLARS